MITYRSDDVSNLGGQTFPFMDGREWFIHSSPLNELPARPGTLEWLSSDHHTALYVKDAAGVMRTDTLLSEIGLHIHGSSLKHDKRVRRVMRPYFIQRLVPGLRLKVDGRLDAKTWDGGGRISRSFLTEMVKKMDLPVFAKSTLTRLAKRATRVEFTVMTTDGQYKGHAAVFDTTEYDLLLPDDPKREVSLDGTPWVGLNILGHNDELWLDQQSLINQGPGFWEPALLRQWLDETGDRALQEVRDGTWGRRFAHYLPEKDEQAWTLAEYLALGGDLMWFRSMAKMAAMIHVKKVQGHNPRTPVPGKRYYLFVDEVVGIQVTPGHAQIVGDSIVVSAQDWPWIAALLGGADQDDLTAVMAIIDKATGEKKVLAWRNPNDVGESILLSPEGLWEGFQWVPMAVDQLPVRPNRRYEGTFEKLEKSSAPYSVQAVRRNAAIQHKRAGILGGYVNTLMTMEAHQWSATFYPMPLERLVDDLVMMKEGLDLSPVREWIQMVQGFLRKKAVARALWGRIGKKDGEAAKDHWLDGVLAGINKHLEQYEMKVETLLKEVKPPAQVLALASRNQHLRPLAEKLNSEWTELIQATPPGREPDWAAIRGVLQARMDAAHLDLRDQQLVVANMVSRIYVVNRRKGVVKSDAAAWIPKFTAPLLIGLLQRLRLIGEFVEMADGTLSMVFDPGDGDEEVKPLAWERMRVGAAFFNQYQRDMLEQGIEVKFVGLNNSIPEETGIEYKRKIHQQAADGLYTGMLLTVVAEGSKNTVWGNLNGKAVKVGYVDDFPPQTRVMPVASFEDDGSLHMAVIRI